MQRTFLLIANLLAKETLHWVLENGCATSLESLLLLLVFFVSAFFSGLFYVFWFFHMLPQPWCQWWFPRKVTLSLPAITRTVATAGVGVGILLPSTASPHHIHPMSVFAFHSSRTRTLFVQKEIFRHRHLAVLVVVVVVAAAAAVVIVIVIVVVAENLRNVHSPFINVAYRSHNASDNDCKYLVNDGNLAKNISRAKMRQMQVTSSSRESEATTELTDVDRYRWLLG